jgi:hypothetical protein
MNISTLEALVEQENRWGAVFGNKPLSLLSAKDRQKIADIIDMKLSPENLSCDGELSRAETNRRYRQYTRAAQELLSIDPNVKFYEFSY